MNKKLLIGGGIAITIIGLLWYLKSNKKNPTRQTRIVEDAQTSAERQKIYDDMYIKAMSFDTSKGQIDKVTGLPVPMTPREIIDRKTEINNLFDELTPKLDFLPINEVKQYQTYLYANIDGSMDDIINDPIKFREYNKFIQNHPDLIFS